MPRTHDFLYEKGDQVTIRTPDHITAYGVITGCNHEKYKNIYDYTDDFGNPRWCAEEDIFMCSNRQHIAAHYNS